MTENVQPSDNITGDLDDQRHEHLQILLWISGPLAFVLLALDINSNSIHGIPVSLFLLGAVASAAILNQFRAKNAAIWAYIVGVLLIPIAQANADGPALNTAVLVLLPVIICSLLRDREAVGYTTVAVILGVIAAIALKTNFITALNFMLLPGLIAVVLAIVVYITEGNVMEMVHWAMDVQAKDSRRAETFYEQKEQLGEAMLQVQHANSALENLNKKLEVAQHKAETASQTKSVFLSNMSHELRTPLNIVIGYSSSMLNMPQMFEGVQLPDIYQPYIKLIEDNGHYLLGLINDILDLSKIEAGKLELHQTPVDLPELLRGTVSTAIGLLKDKPLQLRPDFPDHLPVVWADPLRVRQIILNLMSNAIKFTHTGSVSLSAQVEEDRVRISVSDTGIGIPEKALKTIFDRFQQAEHDTDKHYGGTGLGLDISKQLSQMHGGDLTVTSVVNQGSTFSFTLPIMRAEQITVAKPADETHEGVKIFDHLEISPLQKQAILLVEDEVNTREMLHIALESAGYLVIDANEGQQGMELASGLLPDLILLDAMLPGMDGWDMLGLLKADRETETIPVIMFTAAPDLKRAQDMGVIQVLTKPVTPAQILSSIQAVLKPIAE